MANGKSKKVGEGRLTFSGRDPKNVAYDIDPADGRGRIRGATHDFVTRRTARLEDEEGAIWIVEGPAAPTNDDDEWIEVTVRKAGRDGETEAD